MADSRSDLINQLAASMGAGDYAKTRFEESRFDPETGTLYCDGYVISKSVIDEALQHFKLMQNKCDMSDPASRHMAMIYKTAIEGIKKLQEGEKPGTKK
ncbi:MULTISPECIES: hypothetical protein [unclassified Butyrivibrio]|jgi:hypothetical protein|uniref:hypothetical protein n=1 Tax=unclassified Butyrivibrio TaxID=2639466 RepID=UPI0003B7AAC7|nr:MULTISPECIES: hypothetical protein [unclassified Butyrivibrio]MDC7292305.1 hypothetical protein [Butyrivibrio sp. DSM 10294]